MDNDNILSNENSAATSVSWSQETENVATQKLEEQWTIVEGSLYEEDGQLPQGSVLDECIQWRTQIPYLRIIGRNLICTNSDIHSDVGSGGKRIKKLDNLQNDQVFIDHNLSVVKKKVKEKIESF